MHEGTEMHFPCLARPGPKFFKTMHTIQIFDGRQMSVWQFQCSVSEIAIDFEYMYPKIFRRSTSLGHVIDVTADANHMLYFVLAT